MFARFLLGASQSQFSSKVTVVKQIFVDIPNRETWYALPSNSTINWAKTSVQFIPFNGNAAARGSAEYVIGLDARYLGGTTTTYRFPTDRSAYGGIDRSYVEMIINSAVNEVNLRTVSYTNKGTLVLTEYDFTPTINGRSVGLSGQGTLSLTNAAITNKENVFIHVGHYSGYAGSESAGTYSGAGGVFKFPTGLTYNTPLGASSNYQLYANTIQWAGSFYPSQYSLRSSTQLDYDISYPGGLPPDVTVFSLN